MQGDPLSSVTEFCAGSVSDLDQVGLQERAVLARALAGRLFGYADQVLGELHARYQGQVVSNPGSEGAPLYRSLQGWWRDAAVLTGGQAGRDVRRAAVLRELPVIGQAVTTGVLSQEQAAVLSRTRSAGSMPT